MKLLHVVPTYVPAWRYGGTITSVHALCRALAARGHDVHVMTTNVDGEGDTDVPLRRPLNVDGVQVHYHASPALRRIYWSPDLRRDLLGTTRDFDLVHLHSVFLYPTNIAARIAVASRVPYVLSPRGMLVGSLIAGKSAIAKRAWMRLFERYTIRHAAALHFTSALEHGDADELRLPFRDSFVVPNGVDGMPATDAEREPESVLFLGRLDRKKGLDLLLESIALVPEARLRIVGPDDQGLTEQLTAAASRLGIDARVEILPAVSADERWDVLARAALLVLPSESENFGNVVLEAMAAGTPVVTVPQVGASSVVADAGAGLVVERNREALASAIASLILDQAGSRAMGARGRAHVATNYSWDSIAARMEERYAAIAARPR